MSSSEQVGVEGDGVVATIARPMTARCPKIRPNQRNVCFPSFFFSFLFKTFPFFSGSDSGSCFFMNVALRKCHVSEMGWPNEVSIRLPFCYVVGFDPHGFEPFKSN